MADKKVIAQATVTITALALVSKIFGFVGSFILAAKFGATFKTDAYFVASNIPELLRDVLAGGALTSAFIPVYTSYLAKKQNRDAQALASGIFNLLLISLIGMTALGIVFAPQLTKIVAPGFTGETRALTIGLTRWLFPTIIFLGISSLFGAILNSCHHFTVPALQPLILNTANILCLLFLTKFFGIYAIVVAALIGGIGITVINLPLLNKNGWRYSPGLYLRQEGIKKIGILWFPLLLGLSVNQLNIVINKMLASGLSAGSISSLNYANLINQVAPSVFGVAVSTAIFPSLSWHVALDEHHRFREIVSKALRVSIIITVPLSMALMFLSVPVIRLLFERGAFGPESTALTANVLVYFAVGTFALAVNYVLIRAFYALGDTKTPVKLAVSAVFVNIAMSVVLIRIMKQDGLALASSIAAMLQMGLLLVFLQKKIGNLKLKRLAVDFLKILLVSVSAVYSGLTVFRYISPTGHSISFLAQLASLIVSGLVILVVYALLVYVLPVEEKEELLRLVRRKKIASK